MKHELISPNKEYPFKVFSFTSKNLARLISTQWHESGELLYCLKGTLEVRFSQVTYVLETGDLLFINSNLVHSTRSLLPNEVFVVQFPLPYLKEATQNQYNERCLFHLVPTEQKDFALQRFLHDMYHQYHPMSCSQMSV